MLRTLFDRDTWQEIFGSIQKNKLRTVVTVIGVLWGIFIYITLSGASKGLDNGFEREFEEVAINSLFVWAQNTSIPYDGFRTGRRMQLKLDDKAFLYKRIPQLQYIAPRNARGAFGGSGSAVKRKGKSGSYAIYGDFPILVKIANKDIYDGGRFINQSDIDYQRKVCVIGERTQAELFEAKEDPIGAFIEIDGMYFKVVGVHKFTPGGGFESDSDIFIPFTTFKLLYNTGERVSWFAMAAYNDADVVAVEADIKAALRLKHRVHPDDERAFGSFNLGEIFNRVKGFSNGMYVLSLIVGIATILAGVVGIGNILLISVRERTKELGIRRALGATPREVRSQIIIESVFLTLIAGIIGIILGAFVLALLGYAFKDPLIPFVNPTVPIKFILGALVLMVGLGTLIGLIPAQRAVSIKPIDALREE
ncbi:MAG: multidrug ABC transporter ATP-binding protein [Flavobacteriaceae bacterium]|nr:multidrug ABC transporter ATP-binding protein [Flavobacteriaceae bacterium]|tara:strand:- start:179 stop:1444 length:1266 start_codon:yes stop_codon:yes gene_type:complete